MDGANEMQGVNTGDLRAREIERARFFELSLDLLCVAGLDGYFKEINPSFSRVLGYSEAELLAQPLIDFVHPEDRADTSHAFERLAGGEPLIDFENRYRCKDGELRTLEWRAVVDSPGEQIHAIARDVTEQHGLRAQLLQSQKLEAVGQLAGGLAHDFNNLMLAIIANASFAREHEAVTGELEEYVCEIEQAAKRAADLTRQLLAFSRRRTMKREPVDLNALVTELHRMLRRLIPESVELVFEPTFGIPLIEGDLSQLEQVLVNLCLNARDAMPEGGRIVVSTGYAGTPEREDRSWLRLRVADNGSGMVPEIRERVFEPFFTTKKKGEGTGLGLAMAYGIVEQHGGSISVESTPDEGSVFEIELPVTKGARRKTKPARRAEAPGGSETVLIAEDEEIVRKVISGMLRRNGYAVINTADGNAALRAYEEHREEIAMVLVDVVMPGMSGPELAAALRVLDPELPVLFTSGYNQDGRLRDILPEGARLLDKPFQESELLRRVRQVLDHKPTD
ncbi:response regulator [Pseudenhygromyxa sp. WMMC2535]|nr:response regulator [Pseudenhygromyxa sp. WMMC2535]